MPSLSRRHFLHTSSSLAAFALLRANPAFAAEADLIVRSQDPYNAEPRLLALVADQITPVKHFYVRNHGPIPRVEAKDFKLTVDGMVDKPLTLTLDDLKDRFSEISVEATLTCAGNRRQELSAIKAVGGVQWDAGAIGNANWTGVALADVLTRANVKTSATHVWFEGLDPIKEKDGSVAPFGGSIPLERMWQATSSRKQKAAILAYAMNGQPLTAEHGYPLRSIVPGYIGARSVKWLTKITLSDKPSPNHYVAEAYKLVQSDSKDEAAAAEPIYSFPINAAICAPAAGATVKAGPTRISGYALPSGDIAAKIDKVEVSADGGQTWTTARLIGNPAPFTWQHWTANLDLKPGKHDLAVRASDSPHTMPKTGNWNFKGYLYNGWHHITIDAA
ncbi:MAG TPA: sulfite oxidase [Pirellulaceae bacterium]|jgi:sulfite oxidase